MGIGLSQNEKEALSRFLGKIIEDVDKIATLFESRAADSGSTRTAEKHLRAALAALQPPPEEKVVEQAFQIESYIPQDFYNH